MWRIMLLFITKKKHKKYNSSNSAFDRLSRKTHVTWSRSSQSSHWIQRTLSDLVFSIKQSTAAHTSWSCLSALWRSESAIVKWVLRLFLQTLNFCVGWWCFPCDSLFWWRERNCWLLTPSCNFQTNMYISRHLHWVFFADDGTSSYVGLFLTVI